MRIAFLLDRLNLGGAERHTLNLARALAARGHAIQVIVLFSGGSEQFPLADFPHPPIRLGAKSLFARGLVRQLRTTLAEAAPQTVFAINQTALVAAQLALRGKTRYNIRLCCIFHTTEISSLAGKIKVQIFKRFAARSDSLIFVSRLQAEFWRARGLGAKQLLVIQNAIQANHFSPPSPEARAQMRARFGLAEADLAITLVGRMAPEKNHAWLIRTLAELRQMQPEAAAKMRLVFIGEGAEAARLESLVAELGLGGSVIFAGAHRDIAPLLAIADVGVLVSNAIETFSLAALEFMAMGLPMVMTDIGGAAEIVVPGETGYLIAPRDDAALALALLELRDAPLRARLGAAGRARVLQLFTYEQMVDRYESVAQGRDLSGSKPYQEATT